MFLLRRTAFLSFCVPAALLSLSNLTGCGSSSPSATTTSSTTTNPAALASGGASTVFVITSGGTAVQSFSLTGSGTAATTLTLPSGFTAHALALDTSSSTLYLGGITGTTPQVYAYAASATGTATPSRTLLQGMGNFYDPAAMAVDASGQLYINSAVALTVFAANASGAATPVQLITGTSTQLSGTGEGIAIDAAHNIYASIRNSTSAGTTSTIYVFASGATGNVPPSRSIVASQPWLFGPALDSSLNLYAVIEQPSSNNANASVVKYAAGTSGAATPIATISGGPIGFLGGLLRDSVGNLFMVNATSSGFQMIGYGPGASGTVATPGLSLSLSGVTPFTYAIALQ